jgi:hypothetical protein
LVSSGIVVSFGGDGANGYASEMTACLLLAGSFKLHHRRSPEHGDAQKKW